MTYNINPTDNNSPVEPLHRQQPRPYLNPATQPQKAPAGLADINDSMVSIKNQQASRVHIGALNPTINPVAQEVNAMTANQNINVNYNNNFHNRTVLLL